MDKEQLKKLRGHKPKLEDMMKDLVSNTTEKEAEEGTPVNVAKMTRGQKRLARFMLIKVMRKAHKTEEEIKVELEKLK